MCAIAGLWKTRSPKTPLRDEVRAMIRVARHRGPVSDGYAQGEDWAIGHARLPIIDLQSGDQPIYTSDRSVVVIGNNEIYNAPELREQLQQRGYRFATRSDTEVALHGWLEWGEDLFPRLNGMFALAIVDTRRKLCVLARDPLGIKPLHWTSYAGGIAFASEIKSLLALSQCRREPNRDAIHLFLNFRYVPDERTLFEGIYRLPPGSVAVMSDCELKPRIYFRLGESSPPSPTTYSIACDRVGELVEAGVKRHLLADVEIGTYLSGGIDSSLVSSLAVRHCARLRTFCLAFGEPTDENCYASEVAERIGSRHENISIGIAPLDEFAKVIWHVEEPKVNCLQGFAMSRAMSQRGLKVILSGLGGDELFAGYVNNDFLYPIAKLPRWMHTQGPWSLGALQRLVRSPRAALCFRAAELAQNALDPVSFYGVLRNAFDHNPTLLNALYAKPQAHWHRLSFEILRTKFDEKDPDVLNALLKLETRTKLVNDFLLTEDRVAMAHSVETRVPFLDLDLVNYAFSLPSSYKYLPGNRKRILKDAMGRWLPPSVLSRRKQGFSVNPCLLFETQLREFAARELTEHRVKELELFSWDWIQTVMQTRPSHSMRWHYFTLMVICGFSLWHRIFFEGRSVASFAEEKERYRAAR